MASPLLWVLLCASLAALATGAAGLHLKLTHVDAKENCTVTEHMRRAADRTHRRLASMGTVTAPIHWAGAAYIAEYLIGDPPRKAEAMIDTGSNLVWTQCATCQPCFNQTLSYYNVSQSSTFRTVSCNDTACGLGGETQCASDKKSCLVNTFYGSGNISGALGTEVFTFGSEKVSLAFGCITESGFASGSMGGASGIIGLGRDPLSIVSQLGATKFSYCLTPYGSDATNTSHLFVGESASLSGDAPVTSVPFVKNPDAELYNTFYYLPLAGITVGETKLDVPAAAFDLRQTPSRRWTGTFIDSGTTFPFLVDVAYQALKAELTQQLGTSLVAPPPAAVTLGFDLCVALVDADKLVPPLVLNFGSGGGDLVVPPGNYWIPVDDTTVCMVVSSSTKLNGKVVVTNETTIIANYMTQNMHLLYDLGNGMLSFQAADCSSI